MKKLALILFALVGCTNASFEPDIKIQEVEASFRPVELDGVTVVDTFFAGDLNTYEGISDSPTSVHGWLDVDSARFELVVEDKPNRQAAMIFIDFRGDINYLLGSGSEYSHQLNQSGTSVVRTTGCVGATPYQWDWDLSAEETSVFVVDNNDGTKTINFESVWPMSYGSVSGYVTIMIE